MTPRPDTPPGLALRAYLLASQTLHWLAPGVVKKRLQRGKEDPNRWPEKLGRNLQPRPKGRVIWLHAVGLGEVMSLRGLIAALQAEDPHVWCLVTSTTAVSGQVFGRDLPPRTLHQFLPIDAARYRSTFLDHFRPDVAIWVEQDLWPGFVADLARRNCPQAMIAVRMTPASHAKHRRAKRLFADLYARMSFVSAQDTRTAGYLRDLGAKVRVDGSLKPAAPPLPDRPDLRQALETATQGRFVWAVSPAHADDAALARKAHKALQQVDPTALLIVAPRHPDQFANAPYPKRSRGDLPRPDDAIWVCDSFGELGAIYRIAKAVLVGGTFSDIEGHNPWEVAALGPAILHGPRTGNFATDFKTLHAWDGAITVDDANQIVRALRQSGALARTAQGAATALNSAKAPTQTLARDILDLVPPK